MVLCRRPPVRHERNLRQEGAVTAAVDTLDAEAGDAFLDDEVAFDIDEVVGFDETGSDKAVVAVSRNTTSRRQPARREHRPCAIMIEQ